MGGRGQRLVVPRHDDDHSKTAATSTSSIISVPAVPAKLDGRTALQLAGDDSDVKNALQVTAPLGNNTARLWQLLERLLCACEYSTEPKHDRTIAHNRAQPDGSIQHV